MSEKKPSDSDWFDKLIWVLLIGWLLLGLSQCEPASNSPGNDCSSPRSGVEFGSDC